MIDELVKMAVEGEGGRAYDIARELEDPALLAEFRTTLTRKLSAVERKLAYTFLDFFARKTMSQEAIDLLLSRLAIERTRPVKLQILAVLRFLQNLDYVVIEPFLTSGDQRLREAAIQTLPACKGTKPLQMLLSILEDSDKMGEVFLCANAIAKCGDGSSAPAIIAKFEEIAGLPTSRDARQMLLVALYAVGGPEHLGWLRSTLGKLKDPVQRWLLVAKICRHGSAHECELIAAEIEGYAGKPTGSINLLTGGVPIEHRSIFEAGMTFLQRYCPKRFLALTERLLNGKLLREDREFLDTLLGSA